MKLSISSPPTFNLTPWDSSGVALAFAKCHATGNDFVLVGAGALPPPEKFVRQLCDRHFGIGADGLITLGKVEEDRWRVVIYNCDGSHARLCGNALRAVAAHLWRNQQVGLRWFIESDHGCHPVVPIEDEATGRLPSLFWSKVELGSHYPIERSPISDEEAMCHLHHGLTLGVDLIDSGVPHLLFLTSVALQKNTLEVLGPFWRYHPRFKDRGGVNVSLVSIESRERIAIMTYERGVEAITLSCATGAAAAAVSCWTRGLIDTRDLEVVTPGGLLRVSYEPSITRSLLGLTFFDQTVFIEGPSQESFYGFFPLASW